MTQDYYYLLDFFNPINLDIGNYSRHVSLECSDIILIVKITFKFNRGYTFLEFNNYTKDTHFYIFPNKQISQFLMDPETSFILISSICTLQKIDKNIYLPCIFHVLFSSKMHNVATQDIFLPLKKID